MHQMATSYACRSVFCQKPYQVRYGLGMRITWLACSVLLTACQGLLVRSEAQQETGARPAPASQPSTTDQPELWDGVWPARRPWMGNGDLRPGTLARQNGGADHA